MPDPTKRRFVPKPGVPETSRRVNREEKDWRGYSVLFYDGLMPTQIVRRITESDDHLDPWEATDLPRRVDARPDTDDRRFDGETQQTDHDLTVDERRYVADPGEGKHVFPGLWTGGPVRFTSDKRSGGREITQVLTRTFCAGHGYVVNSNGDVIPVIADSSVEGGWRALGSETSVIGFEDGGRPLNRDGTPVEISAGTVREYATIEQALKSHRGVVKRTFNSRMAFRADIPGMYRTEIIWRDFTHESISFIESDDGKAAAKAAAEYQFGSAVGEIAGVHHEIDANTNTVVIVASALFKELKEPDSVDDLLAMPRVEGPCSRETLRAFGWNDLADAEGYEFVHTYKWFDIKDTPEVRHFLEFDVHDKDVLVRTRPDNPSAPFLPGLLQKEADHDLPFLVDGVADALNGRYAYRVGGMDHAWWRILLMRADTDEQDGSIVFTIVAAKPKWFGSADKRVDASFEAQRGLGASKRTVIPALPREAAPSIARTVTPDENHVVASVQRQQGEKGGEDVVIQQIRAWTWRNGDVPGNAVSLDGSPQSASARRTSTFRKESWDLSFRRVFRDSALSLLADVAAQLTQSGQHGRATVREVQADGEGTVSVSLHVEGVEMKVVNEWKQSGTFYSTHFRRLRFNVPESELEEGGLDETTHEIFQVDRSPNDDGTYDETRVRVKPSAPRHLSWKAKGRRHGRALQHDTYRNAEELPQGLVDGTLAGSASVNEHALIDAQTQEVDEDDDRARTTSEDHFHKETSVRETDGASRMGEAGVANGVITSVQETENADGTFTHTVSKDEAKECDHIRFVTTEGDGHHRRVVNHHVYRNADDMADELKSSADGTKRVSGSDQHNRYGLHDGSVSTTDVKDQDDKGHAKSEILTEKTDVTTEVSNSSRLGEVRQNQNEIVAVDETTYPDGAIRSRVTEETAKEVPDFSFKTKQGSGHHARVVTHTVFRNKTGIPDGLTSATDSGTDRVSGSASQNKFGRFDGEFAKWDAADEDDSGEAHAVNAFERSDSDESTRDASRAGEASGGDGGPIVSVRETAYPDGKVRSAKTTRTPKEQSWSYSYPVNNGDKHGTVRVTKFRNAPKQSAPNIGDEETCELEQTKNEFGLYDGHYAIRPNWAAMKDDVSAGGIQRESYEVEYKNERRVRNAAGTMIDQTRKIVYHHEVIVGTFTLEQATGFIDGGIKGSRLTPTMVRLEALGVSRPGYFCDKVTIAKDDGWKPPLAAQGANQNQNQNQNT